MDFTPHTDAERRDMLAAIGVSSMKDLLHNIPVRQQDLDIPVGLSEGEVLRLAHELAFRNQGPGRLTSYLGAGA